MTTIAAAHVRVPRATVKPIPLTRITAVELRKMFDTRSGFWLIASIAITSVPGRHHPAADRDPRGHK
jgi:ABC-2 type transport system permease protein